MATKELTPDELAQKEVAARRDAELAALVRPFHKARYTVDVSFGYVEQWLHDLDRDYGRGNRSGLNLDPDYQRGHVWRPEQQSRYIEYALRGGNASMTLQWNHPEWSGGSGTPTDLPNEMQLVDGKQRLEAVRGFMRGEVLAFGLPVSAFVGTSFCPNRIGMYRFQMNVHNLRARAELLKFYLALNEGGVVHTEAELARVRQLLQAAT